MDTQKVKETIKRGYIVRTSTGWEIKIDEEELPKILSGARSGEFVVLKQGMVRGDLIAGIVPDEDRIIIEKLDPETGQRTAEMRPLLDVFKGAEFKQLKSSDKKLLEQ